MRLYLSSFRLGDRPQELVALAGDGARVAVIANSTDGYPAADRASGVERELGELAGLGLRPEEVDLRSYLGAPERLGADLDEFDVLWVRGGNVFTLRHVLRISGADHYIVDALRRDSVVYAGYSAGPCVLAPSLSGLELCDDATEVTRLYGVEPTFDGLGVLDFAIVPHVDSPEHPESAVLTTVAERYRRLGVPHETLRDGQAMVLSGSRREIV